jgi:surface antigen/LysM repeat protein
LIKIRDWTVGRSFFLRKRSKSKPKRKGNIISKLNTAYLESLRERLDSKEFKSKLHIAQKSIVKFIKEHRTIKVLHIFRNYSALVVVVSSAILVSTTNLTAGKESSGFLFGYLGEADNYTNPLENSIALKANSQKNNLASIKLAQSSISPDTRSREELDKEQPVDNLGNNAWVSVISPVRDEPEEEGGVIIYEVEEGDTISSIAAKNHISVNTIMWSNEIDNIDSIRPGDRIFILPTDGISYTVKKGDDIENIAKKYKADKSKIIAFNDLPANGELKEGQDIIIPGGQKESVQRSVPVATVPGIAARSYESFESVGKKLEGNAGAGHKFPYGYCTWYVAKKRYVPWSGNAGTWLFKAKSMGYATGRKARAGAIMVTSESRWGHVALVEKVSGNTITVSEMNYRGWAVRSTRVLDVNSRVIKGFIY